MKQLNKHNCWLWIILSEAALWIFVCLFVPQSAGLQEEWPPGAKAVILQEAPKEWSVILQVLGEVTSQGGRIDPPPGLIRCGICSIAGAGRSYFTRWEDWSPPLALSGAGSVVLQVLGEWPHQVLGGARPLGAIPARSTVFQVLGGSDHQVLGNISQEVPTFWAQGLPPNQPLFLRWVVHKFNIY